MTLSPASSRGWGVLVKWRELSAVVVLGLAGLLGLAVTAWAWARLLVRGVLT